MGNYSMQEHHDILEKYTGRGNERIDSIRLLNTTPEALFRKSMLYKIGIFKIVPRGWCMDGS